MSLADEVKIKAVTLADEDIPVMCLTGAGIAQSCGVADAGKAVNPTVCIFVSTEPVVSALDRGNVLEDQVSLCSMHVVSIVIDVRASDVPHREV